MEFLNPGWLARGGVQAALLRPDPDGPRPRSRPRLKRLTGPFVLRRLKDGPLDHRRPARADGDEGLLHAHPGAGIPLRGVVEEATDAIEAAEGIGRKGLVLATLSKLKQVCNHPAQFLGDNSAIPGARARLARLTEMLEEAPRRATGRARLLAVRRKARSPKRHLEETFGREVLFLHGAVAKKAARTALVERFQAGTARHVFVLSLKAGGTGLNLTAANRVFHFDRWWNPAVENQGDRPARSHRAGAQTSQVHKFLCNRDARGEDRRDDRAQERVAANVGRDGRGVADGAVDGGAARPVRAPTRSDRE